MDSREACRRTNDSSDPKVQCHLLDASSRLSQALQERKWFSTMKRTKKDKMIIITRERKGSGVSEPFEKDERRRRREGTKGRNSRDG